jgi:hypothetical protein
MEPETPRTLEKRIKVQFPALFITFLSVLIGLVLADMVAEARTRIALWPLDMETLRNWGQLAAHTASALTAWIVYSHIGISHERVPSISDSIVAFIVPLTLLLAMSLIGRSTSGPGSSTRAFRSSFQLGPASGFSSSRATNLRWRISAICCLRAATS